MTACVCVGSRLIIRRGGRYVNSTEINATESKIDRVEQSLRRWRLMTVLAVLGAGIGIAIALKGRGVQREVRARESLLIGDSGDVIARLTHREHGAVLCFGCTHRARELMSWSDR